MKTRAASLCFSLSIGSIKLGVCWYWMNRAKSHKKNYRHITRDNTPNGHPEDIRTPLQTAAAASSLACSELLIKAGADPNLVYYGFNPLHSAAYGGNVELINLLLQAGANPDATHVFVYQEGYRKSMKPIEIAALQGHNEAVEILFPRTKPIDNIKEWSVDGILDEMQPENMRKKGRGRGQPKSRISTRLL